LLVNSEACAGILKFVCRACEDMAAGGGTDCRHIGHQSMARRLASNPLVVREGFIEPNDEPDPSLTIDEDMLADYPGIAARPTCRRARRVPFSSQVRPQLYPVLSNTPLDHRVAFGL
jgi:hypothetical protein